MKLQGKRAIVTGSSAGIGRSIAMLLAREGASVVINARTHAAVEATVEAIRAEGGTAIGQTGSVDSEAMADTLVSACIDAFGGLDIVINNAAILEPPALGPIDQCSPDIWRRTMAVNLDGAFYLARAALAPMIAQRSGRIINASSKAGTGKLGGSAYSVSKAALVGLTRAMAADFGPYGITVNAYNPEAMTAMGDSADQAGFTGYLHHLENRGLHTAADTAYSMDTGGPDAIAPWVAYLCTDGAEHINGQVFAVESRRIALLAWPHEEQVLYRDHAAHGEWSLDELERMAPIAFRQTNPWPRRTGAALDAWITA